ncbi:hypothetical protein MKW98_031718 [Papaver atlanticum]|uniref:Glutaredoxin domain-containing protein n=2 Tax=Papaver TaxID=3468 RepID=A0A4Y7ITB1_PAPSO|nr:monothiol glutaredoxin-S7-like [Papaver somniferum]XP_026460623.1 monothiol glutaredoxin-S7-like [Papaver somniferum]KAI3848524.1 hypothetical protein MKX03_033326 [Papaver bracteatum]KAI3864126.1 hypothetical protein MKW98_031718 [Papaver atlanticum]KAI3888828.1 hypothetical protein MKW92_002232 [Papaver armeniacum]KAI3909447.1 hypothetical protein MKW92_025341 [Papaver armeniacum]RZC51917.1 hypothetical protein C5167_020340 [Papaver somniferum]
MERVARLAGQKAVVIFSKNSCCMSHSIKSLIISELGVNAAVHELDEDPKGREMERALIKRGCNPAVPAVFIGGELVGGASEVMALHLNGSLTRLLKRVGALWL